MKRVILFTFLLLSTLFIGLYSVKDANPVPLVFAKPLQIMDDNGLYQLQMRNGETVAYNSTSSLLNLPCWKGETSLNVTMSSTIWVSSRTTTTFNSVTNIVNSTITDTLGIVIASVLFYPKNISEYGDVEYEIIVYRNTLLPLVSNTISFTINSKNLNFYYQPPLDKELNAKDYDFLNSTHAIKNDIVMFERPENIVGSYVVYHKSKVGNEYKTGQAFIIYRPLITDANNKTSWATLNITGNTMSISLNSTFLSTAIYPISIDPSFGYETKGGTATALAFYQKIPLVQTWNVLGSVFNLTAGSGTANNMTVYLKNTDSVYGTSVECGMYFNLNQSKIQITNTTTLAASYDNWLLCDFATEPTLVINTEYILLAKSTLPRTSGKCIYMYYNAGDANQGCSDIFDIWHDPYTDLGYGTTKYSIYCNYTSSGAVTSTISVITTSLTTTTSCTTSGSTTFSTTLNSTAITSTSSGTTTFTTTTPTQTTTTTTISGTTTFTSTELSTATTKSTSQTTTTTSEMLDTVTTITTSGTNIIITTPVTTTTTSTTSGTTIFTTTTPTTTSLTTTISGTTIYTTTESSIVPTTTISGTTTFTTTEPLTAITTTTSGTLTMDTTLLSTLTTTSTSGTSTIITTLTTTTLTTSVSESSIYTTTESGTFTTSTTIGSTTFTETTPTQTSTTTTISRTTTFTSIDSSTLTTTSTSASTTFITISPIITHLTSTTSTTTTFIVTESGTFITTTTSGTSTSTNCTTTTTYTTSTIEKLEIFNNFTWSDIFSGGINVTYTRNGIIEYTNAYVGKFNDFSIAFVSAGNQSSINIYDITGNSTNFILIQNGTVNVNNSIYYTLLPSTKIYCNIICGQNDTKIITVTMNIFIYRYALGDLNRDGVVNIFDAALLGINWGGINQMYDMNRDSALNIFDAVIVGNYWGETS